MIQIATRSVTVPPASDPAWLDPQVLYPESDGKPMAENTLQYRWIVKIVSNLQHLLKDKTAFVAGDLFWYPVQVDRPPVPVQAPDALVALGRPAGDRGSYKQWEEDNIAPQVVFEILSPSNTAREMLLKQQFYTQYGVLELFFYDPASNDFWGLTRNTPEESFQPLVALQLPWTSPLLGIRFEMGESELEIFYPNGEKFKDPTELAQERDQLAQERDQISQERDQISQERDQISQERDQISQERDQISQERDQLAQERQRAFAKLRELGIDPNTL